MRDAVHHVKQEFKMNNMTLMNNKTFRSEVFHHQSSEMKCWGLE